MCSIHKVYLDPVEEIGMSIFILTRDNFTRVVARVVESVLVFSAKEGSSNN